MNKNLIIKNLALMFKDAKCELIYHNDYELLIAIILSAQCTDKKVNLVTPILFNKYKNLQELKDASFNDVEKIIHSLGLSNSKAKNIIELAKVLCSSYNEKVPSNKEDLVKLPGVGNKTANVMLIEYFNIPAFPVDTHVKRISNRLGICNNCDDVKKIEEILMQTFPKDEWASLHMRMVLFGRYICKAISPKCNECLFKDKCKYSKPL